jgi:hypothetical protein
MSTFVQVTATCRACGTTVERSAATSVNAVRSPWLRDQILADTFQRESCQGCGTEVVIVVPFLYVDFDRRIVIGTHPASRANEWRDLERGALDALTRNVAGSSSEFARSLADDVEVRTVFGLEALREKIVILEAGLDDAVIEATKARLLATRDDLAADPDARLTFLELGTHDLRFAGVVTGGIERRPEVVRCPRAVYDDLAAGAAPEIVDALRAGPYRDVGRLLGADPVR